MHSRVLVVALILIAGLAAAPAVADSGSIYYLGDDPLGGPVFIYIAPPSHGFFAWTLTYDPEPAGLMLIQDRGVADLALVGASWGNSSSTLTTDASSSAVPLPSAAGAGAIALLALAVRRRRA